MSLSREIRNGFIAGLALLAPLAVTYFVLRFIFGKITGFIEPLIDIIGLTQYTANQEIVAQIVGALIVFVFVTLIGSVAKKGFGQTVFTEFEHLIERIPVVSPIYSSVRQVSDALMERDTRYDTVVVVEWPRKGVYSMGFVTNDSPDEIEETVNDRERERRKSGDEHVTDEDLYNVFIPMSPNPTAGFLSMVPESRLTEVDIPVEKGLRMVLTTGMTGDGDHDHSHNHHDSRSTDFPDLGVSSDDVSSDETQSERS